MLSQSLRECADYESAFRRYEQSVKAYVTEQQRAARKFMQVFLPSTRLGITLQRMVLNIVFRESFTWLLRRQFNVRSLVTK